MKRTKRTLTTSVISLLLCFSMLLGTTYAWFTDSVVSGMNQIISGKLDVELEYYDLTSESTDKWTTVNSSTGNLFQNDDWEPGTTDIVYLRVKNAGNLSFNYKLSVYSSSETTSVNKAGGEIALSRVLKFGRTAITNSAEDSVPALYTADAAGRAAAIAAASEEVAIGDFTEERGLDPTGSGSGYDYFALIVYMPTETGNEANYDKAGGYPAPTIELGIRVIATQRVKEADSFDEYYDDAAEYPAAPAIIDSETAVPYPETNEEDLVFEKDNVRSVVPAESEMKNEDTPILPEEGGELIRTVETKVEGNSVTYDISFRYVDADGAETPVTDFTAIIENYIQIGKDLEIVKVTHSHEGAAPVEMNQLESAAQNAEGYYYDHVSGLLTVKSKSYSDFIVELNNKVAVSGIALESEISVLHNRTAALTAVVSPENATYPAVSWTSSDESVAVVDKNGVVTGKTPGTAVITATADGVSKTCAVTVERNPVTGVTLNETALELTHHDTFRLTANVEPFDATDSTVSWISENPSVAAVDDTGLVTAVGVGETRISAHCDGQIAYCAVTVKAKEVTGVSLPEALNLIHHDTTQLTAAVSPSDATNKTVAWSSSAPEIVSVDENGNIEALSVGSAVITATAGEKTAACTVTVSPKPVTEIVLDNIALSITHHDDTIKLTATVFPADATDKTVTWESSDSEIVSVAGNGVFGNLTARNVGTATITAKAGDAEATCEVTVTKLAVTKITLEETTTVQHNRTKTLVADVTPGNASYPTVTWSSSDETIVTVAADGTITGVSLGTATVTATADGVSASCLVTVEILPASNIEINKTSLALIVGAGDTLALTEITPSDATNKDAVAWSSENASIATVDSNGNVTAVGVGTTTIRATVDEAEATCTVTVSKIDVTKVEVSASTLTLQPEGTHTLSATVLPENATYQTVTWASSDESIATVDENGVVTALAVGKVTITATAVDNSNIYGECRLTVRIPAETIGFAEEEIELNAIGAEITPVLNVTPEDATLTDAVWTSDDESVATVGKNGVVTAVGEGTATITVTVDGKSASCTVTVEIPVLFEKVFEHTDEFLYRVGNRNTVALGKLFKAKEGAVIDSAKVDLIASEITTGVEMTYTPNTTNWTNGTLQFSGTGVIKLSLQSFGSDPVELYLEVVDAKNITGAESATNNNVVLLNNISVNGGGAIKVQNGYSFYGNGFTITCTGKGDRNSSAGMTEGYITVGDKSTLDNVQVIAPIFPRAYLYVGYNIIDHYLQESGNSDDNGAHYNYQLSGIDVAGSATISNCYVYGARTNILVKNGDVSIVNTTCVGGSLANIHITSSSEHTVTLDNVTTVQYRSEAYFNSTKEVVEGLGILVGAEGVDSNPTIIIKNALNQYNWVSSDDANTVSHSKIAQALISSALNQSSYVHEVNGKQYVNLGIVFYNNLPTTIDDQRAEANQYGLTTVSMGVTGQVYSVLSPYGTVALKDSSYISTDFNNCLYIPVASVFGLPTSNSEEEIYCWNDNGTIKLRFPMGDTYDFNILEHVTFGRYSGEQITKSVSCEGARVSENVVTFYQSGNMMIEITVSGSDVYDSNGNNIDSVDYTLRIPVEVLTPDRAMKDAELTVDTDPNLTGVKINSSGDRYYWFDIFDGLTIKDYDKDRNEEIVLDGSDSQSKKEFVSKITDVTPTGDLLNGTANYDTQSTVIFTLEDGRQLTMTFARVSGGTSNSPGATQQAYLFTDSSKNTIYYGTNTAAANTNSKGTGCATQINNKTFKCSYRISGYKFIGKSGNQVTTSDTHIMAVGLYNGIWTQPATATRPTTKFTIGSSGEDSGGGGNNNCLAEGTLITLADGTQKTVENLTGSENLLVWNLETGKYDYAPIVFVDSDPAQDYKILHTCFSDGSDVAVVYEHGFFDLTLGKYVYITEGTKNDYIGHEFVRQGNLNNNTWNVVTLTDVWTETKHTRVYSPVTLEHLCYYTEGMLSMPGGISGLFNIFDVDTSRMIYDEKKMQADISAYGLFTYEDFGGIIPESAYYAFNGAWLKVAIGKGMLTWDDIAYLAERYAPFFS